LNALVLSKAEGLLLCTHAELVSVSKDKEVRKNNKITEGITVRDLVSEISGLYRNAI
jgi:hypothetical protein